jgi:hypothetical protein
MAFITAEGAKKAQLSASDKLGVANALLSGLENISKYNSGVCHDVVAYTLYMLGAEISPNDLTVFYGQNWLSKFNYLGGQKWNGNSFLPKGKAIGFYRPIDKTWFHSAITTGNGTEIRSVNGHSLGTSWFAPADLCFLGKSDSDGTFKYDGTKIEVYISPL